MTKRKQTPKGTIGKKQSLATYEKLFDSIDHQRNIILNHINLLMFHKSKIKNTERAKIENCNNQHSHLLVMGVSRTVEVCLGEF